MHTAENNFEIHALIKKIYEGGKLYARHQHLLLHKKDYEQGVKWGFFWLFIALGMASLLAFHLIVDSKVIAALGESHNIILASYYPFLLFGPILILLFSNGPFEFSSENLAEISYYEENPEGMQQLEDSKQSMENFANDKKTLLIAVKHIDNEHLLKFITDDATQQWAKQILVAEAQERSKWLHISLVKY